MTTTKEVLPGKLQWPPDGRRGRPFTLRLKAPEEEALKKKLAILQAMPWDVRGDKAAGFTEYGQHRRASLGWFILWAAMQYEPPTSTPVRPATRSKGKTKRRPRRGKTRPAGGRKRK